MRKIPTVFRRDPAAMARVLDDRGVWWARREVKPGKQPPSGFSPVETDANTGKTFGWEPIEHSAFAKAFASVEDVDDLSPGTYELCGPKVNGNPEGFDAHTVVSHAGADVLADVPRDFDGLRAYLADFPHEGVVWHHEDGRMAKLKVRDFPR